MDVQPATDARSDELIRCVSDAAGLVVCNSTMPPFARQIRLEHVTAWAISVGIVCAYRDGDAPACETDTSRMHMSLPPGQPAELSFGEVQLCARFHDGSVQCGDPDRGNYAVVEGRWARFVVGGHNACGIDTEGVGRCIAGPRDVRVPGALDVSTSDLGGCFVDSDQRARCWTSSGRPLPAPKGHVKRVAAGARSVSSCAIEVDGTLVCVATKDPFDPEDGW